MASLRARYEFKYLITPEQEAWIRELVDMFCEPDRFGDHGRYNIWSLYFDTWDWHLAQQTVEGQRSRYKLRMRTYHLRRDTQVFCEIKSRIGTSILKLRANVDRASAIQIARGQAPPLEGYKALNAEHQADLGRFRDRMDLADLRPRMWVGYERQAWLSKFGDGARVTFDSQVICQVPDPDRPFETSDGAWQPVILDGEQQILELKFNGAFPSWMQRIVRSMGLRRVSCSKYLQSAQQAGDVPWAQMEWRERWTLS